jgi:hypothetical protein
VVLNLGTHGTVPDIPGLAAASPLTHIEMLELNRLPEPGSAGCEAGAQLAAREDEGAATPIL